MTLILAVLLGGGCNTVAGDKTLPPHIPFGDPLPGHLSFWSWPAPEDWSPDFDVLEPERAGELLDLDLGFLGGFGVGLSGVRARVAAIELALGTPLMSPAPPKPIPGLGGKDDDDK